MVDTIAGLSTDGLTVRHKQDVTLLCKEFPQRENGRMETIYLNERHPWKGTVNLFPCGAVYFCMLNQRLLVTKLGEEKIVLQQVTRESVFGLKTSREKACLGLREETSGKLENKAWETSPCLVT